MRLPSAALGLAVLAFAGTVAAQGFSLPQNDGFVTDTVGILTAEEEVELERSLAAYRDSTSNEIAVVVVRSLSGSVAADVAVEIGRKWQVGTEKDNGIVVLVAYADREAFIATGYGLEGAVPDIVAAGIVERDMVPSFRDGAYAQGIAAAVEALQKHIGGEYTAERYDAVPGEGALPFFFFFLIIALQVLAPVLGASKAWWQGGVLGGVCGVVLAALYGWWLSIPVLVVLGLLFDLVVSALKPTRGRRGRGGWGGGSGFGGGGSSGGFGGFSGGSFGGGGGGGRW